MQVLALGYSKTLKQLALLAIDKNMISSGWAWIGSSDVLGSEEAKIPGNQRLSDAKRAFSIQMSMRMRTHVCLYVYPNTLHTCTQVGGCMSKSTKVSRVGLLNL